MRKSIVTSLTLPPEIIRQTDELAKAEKRNRSEIVRQAIKSYYSGFKWRKLQEVGRKKAEKLGIKEEADIYTWLNKDER